MADQTSTDKTNLLTKKNIAWEAFSDGALLGCAGYTGGVALNVVRQSLNTPLEGPGGHFLFSKYSCDKWSKISAGACFVIGTIVSAVGAVKHNRKVELFTDRLETEQCLLPASTERKR